MSTPVFVAVFVGDEDDPQIVAVSNDPVVVRGTAGLLASLEQEPPEMVLRPMVDGRRDTYRAIAMGG